MKELSLEEVQKISLDGLIYFADVCNKYQLRYYLAFGTLLGAVRHSGFIPWDDDIDILMPREDYDKFVDLSQYLEDEHWEILTYHNTEGYSFYWTKICNKATVLIPSRFTSGLLYGISIDIFPLDYMKSNTIADARNEIKEIQAIYSVIKKKILPFNTKTPGFINSIKRIYKKAYYNIIGKRKYNLAQEYERLEKNFVMNTRGKNVTWFFSPSCDFFFATEWFDNNGECAELTFEGRRFTAPYNYHEVLKTLYGDYMKLPPKEKQITHHTYRAYYK